MPRAPVDYRKTNRTLPAWPGAPDWAVHLLEEHPELYPAARALALHWHNNKVWPTRRELHNSVKTRYPNAVAVDEAVVRLDSLWVRRLLHGADSPVCGAPVYEFKVQNRRGPFSTHWGLSPFINAAATAVSGNNWSVQNASDHPVPVINAEVRAWERLIRYGRPFEERAFLHIDNLLETETAADMVRFRAEAR